MEKLNKLLLGLVLILVIGGGYVVAQELITITFDSDRTDVKVTKCGNDIQCWGDVEVDGNFARFFTLVHEDGTVEKVILIEEFPINATEVSRK